MMNLNYNTTLFEEYIINLDDFVTSEGFGNSLYNFLSKFTKDKSITFPYILKIELTNKLSKLEFIFVYPFIDKTITYNMFFREKVKNGLNIVHLRITYKI